MLADTEIVVLGLIYQGKIYGYSIEKEISERNIRYWTNIAFSSVYYVLKKLEEKKLVEGFFELGEEKRSRKEYRLTETGISSLKESIKHNLSNREKMESSFNLGIGFLGILERSEILECLESYRASINEKIETYTSDLQQIERSRWPKYVRALYERPITILKSERAWVNKFIRQIHRYE